MLADELKSLADKYYGMRFSRKPNGYLDIYGSYLEPLKDRPISILELGVFTGESLLIWREALPNAQIVGLDLGEPPELLASHLASGAISFVQGDQSDENDLQQCLNLSRDGKFDVIIDDASHMGTLSRASFDFLFENGLKDKGLYFAEDFGGGYSYLIDGDAYVEPPPLDMDATIFPSFQGGMPGWLKQVLDEVTVHQFMPGNNARPIASCHFWPNIALIEKL